MGGSPHHVHLTITKTGVRGHCTCSYGQTGVFCKHCVATALTWLADGEDLDEEATEHGVTDEQLRAFLARQDPPWLAEHLLQAAADDPLLRARLEVAAGSGPDVYDTSHVRNRLVNAIAIDDFVDYRSAHSYVTHVHEALDEVEELIGEGFPDAAIELAEFALGLIEEAIELVDDSDGGVGGALGRAQEIHLDACHAGHPDPEELADRLATRALTSGWEVFIDAIPAYADVLGPRGMARYREHVEAAWRALPPREPGRLDGFRPRYLMERLAEHEDGTDALIEVIARDADSAYDMLRIAEALAADGRNEEASDWATRGLDKYGADSRLRSLAASCHLRLGRRGSALELLWANFEQRPSLETYQRLHEAAGEEFKPWRDRAVELLQRQPRNTAGPFSRNRWAEPPGHTTLVEILLWEGDANAAWDAAQHGGCRGELWLRLARERSHRHPTDAIPILQRAAENAIEAKQRSAYQQAAEYLREAHGLALRCDAGDEFAVYVRHLRATHSAKWALREELDRVGLPR